MAILGSVNNSVRIGIWLDDLRLEIKPGLKAAAALHAESAGLDAFGPEISPRTLGRSGRRDLAQYVRSRGLALAALRADVGGRRLADRAALDVNLSRLREALQLAVDLGAPCLVVPAGFIPTNQSEDGSAYAALAEAARTLAEFASSLGVRVCWPAGNETPEALNAFLNKHDPGGMLALDLNPAGFVMRGLEPLAALNLFPSRVVLASAKDQYRGGSEAPFGTGEVHWGELMIAFSGLASPAPLDLLAACNRECDRTEALSATVRRLQALRANPLKGGF